MTLSSRPAGGGGSSAAERGSKMLVFGFVV